MELLCLPLIAITANLITSFTGFLSYYLNNVVGFGVVLAGSFVTIFRIWDAVTWEWVILQIKQTQNMENLRHICWQVELERW